MSSKELLSILNAIYTQAEADASNPSWPGYSEIEVTDMSDDTKGEMERRNFLFSKTDKGYKITW